MVMVDALTFGRRLRHLRKEAGLTLQELGEKVGRPAPYLSMLENGRREPKLSHITDLASALGVDSRDLLADEAPTARAAHEIELERMQQDPRFASLRLPYVRPSRALSDEVLEHLVGLYQALVAGGVEATGRSRLRRANAATGEWLRASDGYLSDVEAVANGILETVGHTGDGPLSSRTLLDIAGHLGFGIEAVDEMVPGVRSVTDRKRGRIYIAQRNELRTRQARKAILQTLAGELLGHRKPENLEQFLRQRVEAAYLAAAILVPQRSVVPRLRQAMDERDIAVEDIKEVFYVSYEMAAWRFVNLATEHLSLPTHLVVAGADGRLVKGYANDGVPFVRDVQGGIEAQPVCRWWGAVRVFDSEDKFAVYAQYTDTPPGTYFCVTHSEPDRPFSVTVGAPFDAAQWFRDRTTDRRARSECPDPTCCRAPTPEQTSFWGDQVEASVRVQERILGRLAPDPYPEEPDRRVYDLVERYSDT